MLPAIAYSDLASKFMIRLAANATSVNLVLAESKPFGSARVSLTLALMDWYRIGTNG